ncbi:MAG: SIS domain-containing protein [Erysipelotrichaceae bacterium]|nr:SIS domain-containing protein [Erysipelotrichaceae bacterium]
MNDFKDIAYREISEYLNECDLKEIDAASSLILKSINNGGRVHLTGIGKPSYVAKYMASLLSSLGIPSYFLDTVEAVHGSLGQVKQDDVVIAISNSGETIELLTSIHALLKLNNNLISVTRNSDSSLAKLSKVHIKAGVNKEGDVINKPPRLSIISEMLALQILSLKLQDEINLNVDNYKMYHPAGSIGKSLKV